MRLNTAWRSGCLEDTRMSCAINDRVPGGASSGTGTYDTIGSCELTLSAHVNPKSEESLDAPPRVVARAPLLF